MKFARRWWGELDGMQHNFQTLVDADSHTLTRVESTAACGWQPPHGVLTGLDVDELTALNTCRACHAAAYNKDCGCCDGQGEVEVCAVGHASANCPCPTRRSRCPDCDGSGKEPMTDEEIEALEAWPKQGQ